MKSRRSFLIPVFPAVRRLAVLHPEVIRKTRSAGCQISLCCFIIDHCTHLCRALKRRLRGSIVYRCCFACNTPEGFCCRFWMRCIDSACFFRFNQMFVFIKMVSKESSFVRFDILIDARVDQSRHSGGKQGWFMTASTTQLFVRVNMKDTPTCLVASCAHMLLWHESCFHRTRAGMPMPAAQMHRLCIFSIFWIWVTLFSTHLL